MKIVDDTIHLSASDLAGHLGCAHLTELDRLAAARRLRKPAWKDPMLEVLRKRGLEHEAAYLDHLRSSGDVEIVTLDAGASTEEGFEQTRAAMAAGAGVIVQATLLDLPWGGRADVLLRVDRPGRLGSWSYEVVDTKLASETRAGTVLQLCLYSEMVEKVQGVLPERMSVVSPGRLAEPEVLRTRDFLAYHRRVKSRLLEAVAGDLSDQTRIYPEPVSQCDYCDWWTRCNDRRHDDDHLSLVAGVTRLQRRELEPRGYDTLTRLAAASLPLSPRGPGPVRGSTESYARARAQARIQLESRSLPTPRWEPLPVASGRGLSRLPEPSAGDLFFDFEGDPFVAGGGREYLFGWVEQGPDGTPAYQRAWALTAADERREFESFVDYVSDRLEAFPDLHIYHFGGYEQGAFKRLMGRHATREDEIDRWLRAGRLVDLHAVVRQGLRVGVERYGLKQLEPLHEFTRALDLREASRLLRGVERALELGETTAIPDESRAAVEAYNRDDCLSTWSLRNWLEERRRELVDAGAEIERPPAGTGAGSEKIEERQGRLQELFEKLLDGVPEEAGERSAEQQGRWILGHLLDWHRREGKATWWEYFRLAELAGDELIGEKHGLGGLEFLERVGGTGKCPVDRYRFAEQDHGLDVGDGLHFGRTRLGSVAAVDDGARTIDVKKRGDAKDEHPTAIFEHSAVGPGPKPGALARIATWVLENGADAPGKYRAARDLLLRLPPRRADMAARLIDPEAPVKQEVRRLVLEIENGLLPVQGPPGSGKTYLGERMICALVRAGKRVGVTAVSHKVIRNLLDAVVEAAREEKLDVHCVHKVSEPDRAAGAAVLEVAGNDDLLAVASPSSRSRSVLEVGSNDDLLGAISSGRAQVAGGTSWAWARDEFEGALDVLVVDEAGQMSLADTLAAATSASSVVLLGDPQQLEQPIQGSHPDGCAASALQHLLG